MRPLMKTLVKVGGVLLAATAAELIRQNMGTIKNKLSHHPHEGPTSREDSTMKKRYPNT